MSTVARRKASLFPRAFHCEREFSSCPNSDLGTHLPAAALLRSQGDVATGLLEQLRSQIGVWERGNSGLQAARRDALLPDGNGPPAEQPAQRRAAAGGDG